MRSEARAGLAGWVRRCRAPAERWPNAPVNWTWGSGDVAHVLVALYAEPGGLAALRASVATPDFHGAFETIAELPTTDMGGREPFGFADGISQPSFAVAGTRPPGTATQ